MQIKKSTQETSRGKLEYSVRGSGQPGVVLINGSSQSLEGWEKIWPDVSRTSTALCYNRLGVEGSDQPTSAQDGYEVVETLRELLQAVGLKPPYVLVGHSLGGLYVNLFTRLYPNEVGGIVFLESSHPNDPHLDCYQGMMAKGMNKFLALVNSLSPKSKFNEGNFIKKTIKQIDKNKTFPEIPVTVITGGAKNEIMKEAALKERFDNQLQFLTLSPINMHIIAKKSGHFPQMTEPKVVSQAIGALVHYIKKQAKL